MGRRPHSDATDLPAKDLEFKTTPWERLMDDTNATDNDNQRYTQLCVCLIALPRINIYDYDAVLGRITKYFEICRDLDLKPPMNGLALALGLDRRRLWELRNGKRNNPGKNAEPVPTDVVQLVQSVYTGMETLWEIYMQNGKINPASGIFLGKNFFGYQDVAEHVVRAGDTSDSPTSDEVRAKYLPPTDK